MPTSTVGDKEASKKAQKNLTKKNTSERINKSIAIRKHSSSLWVWKPIKLSRTKSFHHKKRINKTIIKEKITVEKDDFKLTHKTTLNKREKTAKDKIKGQKEDWIAKNGDLINSIKLKDKLSSCL